MPGNLIKALLKSACSEDAWERIRTVRWRIWDAWHHVETCEAEDMVSFTVVGHNRANAVRYAPSGDIRPILKGLRIDYERYAFVDFGSGKGRVLLLASEFPFKSVEGVEFSIELHQIAERNIRQYRHAKVGCREVKTILADATEFRLPAAPLVLYLFNPFTGPVLGSVVQNIYRSVLANPRDIIIISGGKLMPKEAFERLPGVQAIVRNAHHTVYRVSDSTS